MLYNIYYEVPLGGFGSVMAIDEALVKKMAEAYMRGESHVRHDGEVFRIGSECFHVYRLPNAAGTDRDQIIEYFNKYALQNCAGNFHESVFSDNGVNVTREFLQGREWGDIVSFYNIYINDGANKPIITVLTNEEVIQFEQEFAAGKNPIWVDNRLLELKSPKRIKIFDIEFEYLNKDKGKVKSQIKKWVQLVHQGKWDVGVLEYFGKEVTDQFKVRAFGGLTGIQNAPSSFDWSIIHPEIANQAKRRFLGKEYADAVEASFKEVNAIVKKAYLAKTKTEDDGASLMRSAFAHKQPVFLLNPNSTTSEKNIQEGYMNIFAGVMIGIRNPKAHSNVNISAEDAWEKIVIASHLLKIWDNRITNK